METVWTIIYFEYKFTEVIQNDKLKSEIFCIYLIQAKIFNLNFIDLGEYKFDFTNKTNEVGLAKIPVLG